MVFSKLKERKAPQNNCGREREKASGKLEVKSGNEEDKSKDEKEDSGKKTDEVWKRIKRVRRVQKSNP
jgi:hypothetical protein